MKGAKNPTRTFALVGNPNVGKSTLFNALTHRRQHTGNWPGKTVETAHGVWHRASGAIQLIDLPGTYTLTGGSPEEVLTGDFLEGSDLDGVILVCDATCLARSLILAVQVLQRPVPAVLCLNLMDEAQRRGLQVDSEELERLLGIPVIPLSAGRKQGLHTLSQRISESVRSSWSTDDVPRSLDWAVELADRLASACTSGGSVPQLSRWDRLLFRREVAWPLLLLLLGGVLWITVVGANLPSSLLSAGLLGLEEPLTRLLTALSLPNWCVHLLVEGIYRVLAWVVAVMLPPMAIFFPLFTLLEEWGLLPRVAFVTDHIFSRCGGCGRQSLTLCMSLGCNAVGVSGCRIIESPRERLIALLTASLVPCNGRFPTLVTLSALFFAGGLGQSVSALMLLGLILLGIAMALLLSKLLSVTLLKGEPSAFTMELPPFRRPQIGKVLFHALLDRTCFVLSRALLAAAPAGAVIWLLANVSVHGTALLGWCTAALNPVGVFLGMDGVLLMAFLLGAPANEIVLPVALMAYLSSGGLTQWSDLTALQTVLCDHGWTAVTALCTMLFSLFHWPCIATCQTIQRETGDWKWTALAVILPTACGVVLCALVKGVAG